MLLKQRGEPLAPEAVASLYVRMREEAHRQSAGHLWLGQPVAVGRRNGRPLSAIRLSISARHLATFGPRSGGCGQVLELAEACLWEMSRLIAST
jgi:hypothetical protein